MQPVRERQQLITGGTSFHVQSKCRREYLPSLNTYYVRGFLKGVKAHAPCRLVFVALWIIVSCSSKFFLKTGNHCSERCL